MGWKARLVAVGLGIAVSLACTPAPICSQDTFAVQASVPATAVGCTATFSRGDAALVVGIADLGEAGCWTKDMFLPVACTSNPPEALVCNRLCETGVGDFVLIQTESSDAGLAIHALLGNPPPNDSGVGTSVVCNGTQIDAAPSILLETCEL